MTESPSETQPIPNSNIEPPTIEILLKEAESVSIKKDPDGYLLAPNGERSQLNESLWRITRTPSFKKWFGDWENPMEINNTSKIVDDNGEPLVVFHGTRSNFDKFDPESIGKNKDSGYFGSGFYFTQIREFAQQYGDQLLIAILNVKNPFIYDGKYKNARHRTAGEHGILNSERVITIEDSFPPEIDRRVHEIYEQLKMERVAQIQAAEERAKSNPWGSITSSTGEEQDFESCMSQAIRQALIEIGKDGVIATNPVSMLPEINAFEPAEILILGKEKS